jgi:hypothetical protein
MGGVCETNIRCGARGRSKWSNLVSSIEKRGVQSGGAMDVSAMWASIDVISACVVVVVWAATGPIFHYSDMWQLIINTGTTIITFLMVFLIQNTRNRIWRRCISSLAN